MNLNLKIMRIFKLEKIDIEKYHEKLISEILKDWKDEKITSADAIIKLSYIGTIEAQNVILSIKMNDFLYEKKEQDKASKEKELRGTGRTTRLVDYYIQKLFNEGTTGFIKDHDPSLQETISLYDKIIRRLFVEHPGVKVNVKKKYNNFIISLYK